MKFIVNLLRVLVGLVFIFSGLIKSNDPTGFSYKLDEYFSVFADDLSTEQDSVFLKLNSVDGELHYKQVIVPEISNLQFTTQSNQWLELDLGDGLTAFLGPTQVKLGSQVVQEFDLSAMPGDSVVHELSVAILINDDLIAEESISYIANQNNAHSIQIDTSPYIKSNSWIVGFLNGLREFALTLAIFICVFEIILGIALIIGWAPKFTLWMLLLMLLFFAFLTFYSAQYDKVTDCGCFGDAIKLTPWQSFNKDLILLIAVSIIYMGRRFLKPIFSNPFSVRMLTVFTLMATGFSLYCWYYLPVKNFLKFKEGADIRKQMEVPEGGREQDHVIREYIYDNAGVEVIVTWDSDDNSFTPAIDKEWKFVKVGNETILEKRDEPPIHDFKIMDESQSVDYVDDFFNEDRWKIMIVMNDLDKSDLEAIPRLKELIAAWKEAGYAVYPLTASEQSKVEAFRHEHQLDVPFYYGDKTNLKSIVRSNPGLVMVDSTVVVKTWPSTRLPKVKKLMKLTE